MKNVLQEGSVWAVENDFGDSSDIDFTEESGTLKNADADLVSPRAIERGITQVGTLGSGNHFLEVDIVDEIYDEKIGKVQSRVYPAGLIRTVHGAIAWLIDADAARVL